MSALVIAFIIIDILVVLGLIFAFGPKESRQWRWSSLELPSAAVDLDDYLAKQEVDPKIKPNLQKEVVWASKKGEKTDWSIVYLHGYTASKKELDPMIDQLAEKMGANLFYARFKGHGLDDGGEALDQASYADWVRDTQEAVEIGAMIGKKVLVASCSTGGSMAIWACEHMGNKIDALAFVSPNFKINNPLQALLTLPWAQALTLCTQPRRRCWDHEDWWGPEQIERAEAAGTMEQYTTSVLPVGVAALMARSAPFEEFQTPALFQIDPKDGTVVATETSHKAYPRWGAELKQLKQYDVQHSNHHVLFGDLVSPGTTQQGMDDILDFIKAVDRTKEAEASGAPQGSAKGHS